MKLTVTFDEHFRGQSTQEIILAIQSDGDVLALVDRLNASLFDWAIRGDKIAVTKVLLDILGDVNLPINTEDETPLIVASKWGVDDIFKEITQRPGVRLLQKDKSGWNALHHAANKNRIEQASQLIQKMSAEEITLRTGQGLLSGLETPAHIAAMGGHTRIILLLSAKGTTDVLFNLRDQNGKTPLYDAVARSQPKTVRALLILGADPEVAAVGGKNCYQEAESQAIARTGKGKELADSVLTELLAFRTGPALYRSQALDRDAMDRQDGRDYSSAKCMVM